MLCQKLTSIRHRLAVYILLLCSFFWVLLSCSCSKKSTEPPPESADTTSHNFVWQIDTIGLYSSYLLDVSVISENEIWAVGEIHTAETDTFDSLGNWIPPYNAVHWNGSEWRLIRTEAEGYGFGEIYSVFAFSPIDIWMGSTIPEHWDGQQWTFYGLTTGYPGEFRIRKIWGTSSENLYFVGNNGNIVHYTGQSWQRIESSTTIDLLDIYGSPDGSVIWACGYTDFVGTVLLKITGTTVEKVYEDIDNWFTIRQDSISGVLTSLWTDDPSKLYIITPAGMYLAPANTRGEAQRIWFNNDFLPGFPRNIRGQAGNDIVTVGDFHMISHYNGASWRYFEYLHNNGGLRAVSICNDLIVAVGVGAADIFSLAIVITGRR